jgi:hypothetical protein
MILVFILCHIAVKMVERKLLILESYVDNKTRSQMWRITNPPGISFFQPIEQYEFVTAVLCRPGVTNEVSKAMEFLQSSGERWYE